MWICDECGRKYGSVQDGVSTWHLGECEYCNQETSVTEDRDYGIRWYPYPPEDQDTFRALLETINNDN